MAWFNCLDSRAIKKWLAWLLLVSGMTLTINSGWIYAKALLAQQLIATAWWQSLHSGAPVRPWPWADTWPVGRLRIARHEVDLYTLEGLHGSALAFGPGQLTQAAAEGDAPSRIIAGHRDTHFRFMRELAVEDEVLFTDSAGQTLRYRIVDIQVVDSRQQTLALAAGEPRLVLVTCYPFDAIDTGGPLRYVVTAALQQQPMFAL